MMAASSGEKPFRISGKMSWKMTTKEKSMPKSEKKP